MTLCFDQEPFPLFIDFNLANRVPVHHAASMRPAIFPIVHDSGVACSQKIEASPFCVGPMAYGVFPLRGPGFGERKIKPAHIGRQWNFFADRPIQTPSVSSKITQKMTFAAITVSEFRHFVFSNFNP